MQFKILFLCCVCCVDILFTGKIKQYFSMLKPNVFLFLLRTQHEAKLNHVHSYGLLEASY